MRTKAISATFIGILFVTMMIYAPVSFAEVNVSIGIGVPAPVVAIPAPPPVVIHAPPPVVVIPGTYVYFAPDVGVDIFFYHGYWYRPHHGHWYRAKGYDGPWDNIEGHRVPHVVRNIPPDFRHSVGHYERIRHVDLQRNWKTWEQKKHWDRHDYRHPDRHDYRHEDRHGVRGGYDGKRSEDNYSRPYSKHEVRDVHYDRGSESSHSRLGGGGRPEVREVRDVHDGGKWESEQSKPEGRGKHDR